MTTILQCISEKISLGSLDEEIEMINNWTEDVVFPRTSPRLVIQSALETNTHATERLSKLYFYADWFMLTTETTVRSQDFWWFDKSQCYSGTCELAPSVNLSLPLAEGTYGSPWHILLTVLSKHSSVSRLPQSSCTHKCILQSPN